MASSNSYELHAGHGTLTEAFDGILEGARRYPIWLELVRRDVKSRTKGASLGSLWLVIAQAVAIGGMGFVYAELFKLSITDYLPYLATGLITWGLIIQLINESIDIFTYARGFLTQVRLPLSLFVFRHVGRNLALFAYKATIIVAVLALCGVAPGLAAWQSLLGLAAILVCGFFFGYMFGMIAVRYRDVGQLLTSLTVFLFFVTPVFWKADRLGPYQWVADYNPLYHFLTLVRAPLLGEPVTGWTYFMISFTIVIVLVLWAAVYRALSKDVIYWL